MVAKQIEKNNWLYKNEEVRTSYLFIQAVFARFNLLNVGNICSVFRVPKLLHTGTSHQWRHKLVKSCIKNLLCEKPHQDHMPTGISNT